MKITLLLCGKTSSPAVKALCDDYLKRIYRYTKIEEIVVEAQGKKHTESNKLRETEGRHILKRIAPGDFVVLLDDKGKEFTSGEFASYLQHLFNQSYKNLCFVVGGAYGFSDEVYTRANAKISLSKMTFSHQIIRPIFMEQLYRAFTIINHEPYHHE